MHLYPELEAAMRTDDADRYARLLAEDFQYVRHKSRDAIGREEMRDLLAKVWRPGNRQIETMRCLYENGDILVVHTVLSFASGSREGAMIVHRKRDGRIVSIESGVSDLSGGASTPNAPTPDQISAAASVSGPIPHETST